MTRSLTRRQMLALLAPALAAPGALLAATQQNKAKSNAAQTPAIMNANIALSDLDLTLVDQQWNVAGRNLSVGGKPLRIGGRTFATGVGTHADSRIVLHLNRGTRRFRALVGVDDEAEVQGSVRFSIQGDGKELWNSGVRKKGDAALPVDLDVSAVQWLVLHADDGGDGIANDHADWAEAAFQGVSKRPVIVSRLPKENGLFLPDKQWTDTDGKLIQAHGGGLLKHGNEWWWHGEDRSNGYVAIGASAYVSTDLVHWKRSGLALPRSSYDQKHGDQTICERPKVIYNPTTKKFVMWFHYDRSGYGDSRGGVAVADHPAGPFQFLGAIRPVESSTFRDMNLFVDDDGKAYVFYAGEGNPTMHVVRLNDEWTAPQQPMVEGQTWARILVNKMREAPAPFKHDGKYYLITSACTGWSPNAADLAVADSPLGPYKSLGNPCVGPRANTTFDTQSTYVLPVPGAPGHFIFLADRWKPEALADARYIWLPFKMENGRTTITWRDSWRWDAAAKA